MTSPARTPAADAGLPSSSWTTSRPRRRPSRSARSRPQRPRPADDPEERPADAAVVHQGADDRPGRGVDRHGQAEADPGDGRVDPDDPAAPVGERPARVAGVERGVGLDDVLDEPARPPVAGGERSPEGADDAGGHAAGEPERVADRDDELADAEPVGVAERRGGKAAAGRPDDREVGERVAPDDVERRARCRRRRSRSRSGPTRRRGPTSAGSRPA